MVKNLLQRHSGWHDLRLPHLAMRGVPLRTIQELLGHASIEQTMHYAHLSPEVKRDGVKVLEEPAPITAPVGAHERRTKQDRSRAAERS